jgi:flagellar hook-associated protein 2
MAGISVNGLVSGINTDQMVSQLMAIERQPEQMLKQQQTDYQTKIAALLDLQTKLGSFKSSLQALNDANKFNTKQASVTNTTAGNKVLTASATSAAALGTYAVEVNQLAQAGIKASQGWADPNTTPIAGGAGSLSYRVGSAGALTTISVSQNMTLQGLRDAINTAGSGVTASIVNNGSGSNPYRLVLASKSAGSANAIYITQNNTNLDFTHKKIGTAYAYAANSYSGNVYANSGNYYTGTDNKSYVVKVTTAGATSGALTNRAKYQYSTDGGITWSNEIAVGTGGADATADIVIDSTNNTLYKDGLPITLSEGTYTGSGLATELETKLGAGYAVSYDGGTRKFTITNNTGSAATFNWSNSGATAAGVLGYNTADSAVANGASDASDFDLGMFIDNGTVANSTNGRVKIYFGTSGTLALGDKFSVDAFNPEMQTAQDAVIKVGNSTMMKNSNTITDAIEGVTLNLLDTTPSSPVTLTVSGSSDAAKSSIKDFVTAYNTMADFLNTQLSHDPSTTTANPLLGDPTLLEIRSKIARVVTGTIPGLGTSSYTNLSQIGITSDATTGKLSLDDSKVASALSANPDSVAKLFIGTATATNQAVSFVSKTSRTRTGSYSVYVATAAQKATLLGGKTIAPAGISADETLTFQYSNDKSDRSPTYTNFSVSLSAGAGVNNIVNTLNGAFATHNAGLTASNENGQIRITSISYGADQYFKVTSDKGNIAGQVGFNADGTSNGTGVDVVGTINGHVAKGVGNQLTSKSGLAEDGLTIAVESSQPGGFGTVTISSGIADKLPASLTTYTDGTKGILKSKEYSIQKSIDAITSQIQAMEVRFTKEEQNLKDRFARLETLLQQYSTTSQYLSMQLAALTGSSTSSSSTSASSIASNTLSNNASNSSSSDTSNSSST